MKSISFLYILLFSCLSAVAQYRSIDYTSAPRSFTQINDGYKTINPIVSEDGRKLWFTKIGHPANIGDNLDQDIWESTFQGGEWHLPTNRIPGINTNRNDLIVGQSENNLIYIVRYDQGVENKLSVIEAYRKDGSGFILSHQIEIPNLNFHSQYFGFYVSRSERYIIISMKGNESFGKEDLYVSQKVDGNWTDPLHLGARINSQGFEMSPYMSLDEKHLFFSSEGHGSYGSADVYVSVRLDESWTNWSKPFNLGPNINSEEFEAYFCVNEAQKEAYFVSNRDGKIGTLYRIAYKPSTTNPAIQAHNSASGFIRMEKLETMSVKLNLLDENDQIIQSVTTTKEGYFNLQSFLPDKDYKIAIDDSIKEDLSGAEIFLTNDLGDQMIFMNEDEFGIFGFKVLTENKAGSLNELEDLASKGKIVDKPTKISGKVDTYGTLKERITLNVVDENNKVVETITTDNEGFFSFSTNAREKSYFLSVDDELHGLVDVYEIYLTNENPGEDIVVNKTNKHLFEFRSLGNSDAQSGMELIKTKEFGMPEFVFEEYGLIPSDNSYLKGYLKYDKLPLINTEISLVDENDRVLSTVTTDDEGMFAFNNQLEEGKYTLKLTSEQQELLDNSEIYLAKNPDDMLLYLNDNRAGVFAFKKLTAARPMTLYSLRTQTESGLVVNDSLMSIRGKFKYQKLPEQEVTLNLLDESENIVQTTTVDRLTGEFEFSHYSVNKNYFISVESSGLSDIYEIYLSGQNKNVLVNRTNKFVFTFKVLPTQDLVLSQAFETNPDVSDILLSESGLADGDAKRSYFEYDLNELKSAGYSSINEVADDANNGYYIVIRLFREVPAGQEKVNLKTVQEDELQPVIDQLIKQGVNAAQISTRMNGSDQLLIIIQ